ncbi:major facilitator superfamily domain-containing protein [Mycena sp. CBHHK59/15]|nr:major facilitator superfamily domain-containing protein [Mycena sp. CBHHK59/15]
MSSSCCSSLSDSASRDEIPGYGATGTSDRAHSPASSRSFNKSKEIPTPLPRLQILIILCIQFAEPITSTVIFPFINQLVRETGITGGDERKTGYFAGIIESLFYAAEALTVVLWGRGSDIYGRKPILLVGLLGMAVSILSFGLSNNYFLLLVSRAAQGVFNGNIGVTKGVMGEITDASNVAQAFAFIPTMWSTGLTVGPIIGGVLARPAEEYPNTRIGKIPLLKTYPYLLSCAGAALVPVVSFVLALLFLKETLPSKNAVGKRHAADGIAPEDATACDVPHSPVIPIKDLLIERVLTPIYNYIFLAFMDQSIQVLLALLYSTHIQYGGLGFDNFTIGVIMGSWGLGNGVFQVYALPFLLRKLGIRGLYRLGFGSYIVSLAFFPLLSLLAKRAGRVDGLVWAAIVLHLMVYSLPFLCYGCIFVYISDGSPGTNSLGTTNALAQLAASTIRAVAPICASSLFSFSLESGIAGGTLVYWVLMLVVLAGLAFSAKLPESLLSEKEEEGEREA